MGGGGGGGGGGRGCPVVSCVPYLMSRVSVVSYFISLDIGGGIFSEKDFLLSQFHSLCSCYFYPCRVSR